MPRSTILCRVLLLCLVPACAAGEADEGRLLLPSPTGVHVDESSSGGSSSGSSSGGSTGDGPADVSSSSGGEGSTSAALLEETTTGDDPGEGSTSGSSSTGDAEAGTSTGDESSGGESSSTGEPEPEPAVCGDGMCEASERASCWAWDGGWTGGFCFLDCAKSPECLAEIDCECTPEAAALKNWCNVDPLPACSVTAPGGLCSQPQGDAPVFYMHNAKCS